MIKHPSNYVIRVILHARDDLSLTLAKIREEIRENLATMGTLDLSLEKVNERVTSLNSRGEGRATRKGSGQLKQATDNLSSSIQKFLKNEKELEKAKDLTEKAANPEGMRWATRSLWFKKKKKASRDPTQADKDQTKASKDSDGATKSSTGTTKGKTAATREAERAARASVEQAPSSRHTRMRLRPIPSAPWRSSGLARKTKT